MKCLSDYLVEGWKKTRATLTIPPPLWERGSGEGHRDLRGQVLFTHARKMRRMVDLTDEDIQKIAGTYHAWRGEKGVD